MKKWIIPLILSTVLLPLAAQAQKFDLDQILRKATMNALPQKPDMHARAALSISLYVDMELGDKQSYVSRVKIPCTAVRIAPDYLLASLTCKGQKDQITNYHMLSHDLTTYYTYTPIKKRTLVSVNIDQEKVTTFTENEEERLLLIKLDDTTLKEIKSLPVVHVAFFEQTKNLLHTFNQFFVNRRILIGDKRTFTQVTAQETGDSSFVVYVNKSTALLTGDPLFAIPTHDIYKEYFLGFNSAQPNGDTLQSGNEYRFLSMQANRFLQENMDEYSWNYMSKRALIVK